MASFDFTAAQRKDITAFVQEALEDYYQDTGKLSMGRLFDTAEVQSLVNQFDFDDPDDPKAILEKVTQGLRDFAIHTPHPSYYGLFNPRPGFASILADYISATFNPQLAAWSHAPFANEIEKRCITALGGKLGFDEAAIDGTFCSGGAESNLTAVLCALNQQYPDIVKNGVRDISSLPTIYVSAEAHHSMHKAAKVTGLGINSIRTIPVDAQLRMDTVALQDQIQQDLKAGHQPLMIVATLGTTGAGAIDDVEAIHAISKKYDAWLHVDAAYGAGLGISSTYGHQLGPVHHADSMTIDLHKWFAVPMGASMIILNDQHALTQTFSIRTAYMPDDNDAARSIDPYSNSIQWSRRAIGLKFFLPLAIHGWKGYDAMITGQIDLAHYLRQQLEHHGWEITNDTILPLVCFTHPAAKGNEGLIQKINDQIIESGQAWCSVYPIHGESCIRACIINYATTQEDIDNYLNLLNEQLQIALQSY